MKRKEFNYGRLSQMLAIAVGASLIIVQWRIGVLVCVSRIPVLYKLVINIGTYFAAIGAWTIFWKEMTKLDKQIKRWIQKENSKKVIKRKEKIWQRNGNKNSPADFRANAIEVDFDIISEAVV